MNRDQRLEDFLREVAACGVAWRRLPAVERALNTYLFKDLDPRAVRREFEQWYVENAFNLETAPLGGYICDMQWRAYAKAKGLTEDQRLAIVLEITSVTIPGFVACADEGPKKIPSRSEAEDAFVAKCYQVLFDRHEERHWVVQRQHRGERL